MPKFRSIRPPERQAQAVVGRLVNLGALRRNPKRPASVRTVANYRDCLLQIARRIAPGGRELRDLTPETAVEYLRSRTADLGQKALDMHRQSLQAMLVHVSRRLPEGERLTVVRSAKPRRTGGRAYRPEQIRMVAAAQNARNGLSTLIAHAAGLRSHELLTLARPGEQPPDRGIHYLSRYDVAGGTPWSVSFSGASKRALGWTAGAHGARHAYAQERMDELQRTLVRAHALETVSQELGHFRPDITETYLR